MRYVKILISSLGAGILIALGGFVFLSYKETNLFLASFLFSLGLLTVIGFKLYLFTGKIGYAFEGGLRGIIDLIICWIGNFIGALSTGYLLRLTRADLQETVEKVVETKLNDNLGSIFVLSLFCGMMIYIAVEFQKRELPGSFKLLAIILPVMVFIISGFEHCVANMFYISYASMWSWKAFGYIMMMTLGNGVGSIILWGINKVLKIERREI